MAGRSKIQMTTEQKTAEQLQEERDQLLAALTPLIAFARAMTECYDRYAPPCRVQQQGRDCFWQQGFMPYSEYQPKRMCDPCAAAWYARNLAVELEDHLRHVGHRPVDIAAAVAAQSQARLVNLSQLVHEVEEIADRLRSVLGPRCTHDPKNCRRQQALAVGRTALLTAEVNPQRMCRACTLVLLADLAAGVAQRLEAPLALDPTDGTERAP